MPLVVTGADHAGCNVGDKMNYESALCILSYSSARECSHNDFDYSAAIINKCFHKSSAALLGIPVLLIVLYLKRGKSWLFF